MASGTAIVACWLGITLALAASRGPLQAQSAPPLSNIGTLTCITSDTPPAVVADAELSCGFHAASGRETNYTGFIARQGQADLPAGKRVLIWSVQATSPEIDSSSIAGKYAGQTGGRSPGRLIGGIGGTIILDPVNRSVGPGEGPVPTVLELRLEFVRA